MSSPVCDLNIILELKKAILPVILTSLFGLGVWLIQNTLQTKGKELEYKIALFKELTQLFLDYRTAIVVKLEYTVIKNERIEQFDLSSEDYFKLQEKLKQLAPSLFEKQQKFDEIHNKLLTTLVLAEQIFGPRIGQDIIIFREKVIMLNFNDHIQIYEDFKQILDPNFILQKDKIDYEIIEFKLAVIEYYNRYQDVIIKNIQKEIFK
ncbi:hypothetical protein EGH10_20835 [Brevibacillus laterosporus]|uniref:Uncharacterized protein n=1 Tax=Brevibacillus laterosporus LMG 15441 TaxID=1042163 RepID=A0A075R4H1_BRELA|nr:hypothetical protein [Brevibacillus laterosporus]AIG27442.1 hypothetical protein BRLA_c031300 [Brevibacillus laterosporus LMG 15441]RJL15369.1 hypothetical protein DM460_00280 [Brevibacillus laterosporus]TPH06467.1 hypothetical protein EGH10_20835 [Brevibacillus laterosporus]